MIHSAFQSGIPGGLGACACPHIAMQNMYKIIAPSGRPNLLELVVLEFARDEGKEIHII